MDRREKTPLRLRALVSLSVACLVASCSPDSPEFADEDSGSATGGSTGSGGASGSGGEAGGGASGSSGAAGGAGCANTMTDPKNCGECERDCLEGGCKSGQCTPFKFEPAQPGARDIVVDGTHVYWARQGTSNAMTMDGAILRADTDGQNVTNLRTGEAVLRGLAYDGQKLYWGGAQGAAISRIDAAGSGSGYEADWLTTGVDQVTDLAFYSGEIYWVDRGAMGTGGVRRVTTDGLAQSELASNVVEPVGIAVDASGAYWVARGAGATSGEVWGADLDGSNARMLATGLNEPQGGIALDGTHTYFCASDGIWRVLKDGSAAAELFSTSTSPRAARRPRHRCGVLDERGRNRAEPSQVGSRRSSRHARHGARASKRHRGRHDCRLLDERWVRGEQPSGRRGAKDREVGLKGLSGSYGR